MDDPHTHSITATRPFCVALTHTVTIKRAQRHRHICRSSTCDSSHPLGSGGGEAQRAEGESQGCVSLSFSIMHLPYLFHPPIVDLCSFFSALPRRYRNSPLYCVPLGYVNDSTKLPGVTMSSPDSASASSSHSLSTLTAVTTATASSLPPLAPLIITIPYSELLEVQLEWEKLARSFCLHCKTQLEVVNLHPS